jgi:hypothetical protein
VRRVVTGLAALLALALPCAVAAQQQPADSTGRFQTELESMEGRPSPRGAMFRSFILPGWGQASYDRWVRAGVYFTGHLGNAYMVYQTLDRLGDAKDREDEWVSFARDSLEADPDVPADSVDVRIDADPRVRHARALVNSREEQREDWIALGVFWVLIAGVDAYVTAQLADFPASIGAIIDDRRVGVMVTVPVR